MLIQRRLHGMFRLRYTVAGCASLEEDLIGEHLAGVRKVVNILGLTIT